MKKKFTTVEELVADEQFQNFCLAPDADQTEFWNNWLIENPKMQSKFEEAQTLILAMSTQVTPKEIGEEFNRFQQNIAQQKVIIKHVIKYDPDRRKLLSFSVRAAAVALVLGAGFWMWNSFSEVPVQKFVTNFGETKNIDLPDGSIVILNANSQISFVENWKNEDFRELNLEGEAFFEIETNSEQPLLVKTEKGTIRVLGTTFNALQRNDLLDVTLLEGKVQIALPNQSKINLNPNERVRIAGKTIDHEKVDPENITAWRKNKMKFKNASISSVIERLKNDFGWQIEVKNKELLKRKINASIPENDPKLLLEALSQIYDLKIEKMGERQYIIR